MVVDFAAVMATPDHSGMRPFTDLAPFPEARRLALDLVVPVEGTETLALSDATGRVAASDVRSRVDIPNADRSAMDGFALVAADADDGPLPCVGRVAAGQPPGAVLRPGTCIEVATGAVLPQGADAVVPVEETRRQGDEVAVESAVASGQHVIRTGDDVGAGTVIAPAGAVLNPARIAALAAAGTERVEVRRRPRVLLVSTGDEVVPVGQPLEPGQVHDSNGMALASLFRQAGAVADSGRIVPDEDDPLDAVLTAADYDLVVTIAGSSVGRRDLVRAAVDRLGEVLLHGVAVKPGKPLLLGRVGGCPVVGLPGFPTSCLLLGYAVVEPMVRRLGQLPPDGRRRRLARLAEPVDSPTGKYHLLPVALDGHRAIPVFRGSSAITSMSLADGWLEIDTDVEEVPVDTEVEVTEL